MKYWFILACLTCLTLECAGYPAFSLFDIWPDTGFLFAGYLAWPDTGYLAYSFFMSCLNYFSVISRINVRQNIRYLAKADLWPAARYPVSGKNECRISSRPDIRQIHILCTPTLNVHIINMPTYYETPSMIFITYT